MNLQHWGQTLQLGVEWLATAAFALCTRAMLFMRRCYFVLTQKPSSGPIP